MAEFDTAATGGTFDIIHAGHKKLLSKSFEIADNVIVGLVSDRLAGLRGKNTLNDYQKRYDALASMISRDFGGRPFHISMLEDDFGPAVLERRVEALVVSEETESKGAVLNRLRAEKSLPPVKIVTVPMHLAKDGRRISSTRIRDSEIDPDGNLL